MTTLFHIPLHLRDEALSANGREHWRTRSDKTRSLRTKSEAFHRGCAAEVRNYGWTRMHLTVWVTWPDRRRRDVANLHPTVKALVDGFRDAMARARPRLGRRRPTPGGSGPAGHGQHHGRARVGGPDVRVGAATHRYGSICGTCRHGEMRHA